MNMTAISRGAMYMTILLRTMNLISTQESPMLSHICVKQASRDSAVLPYLAEEIRIVRVIQSIP